MRTGSASSAGGLSLSTRSLSATAVAAANAWSAWATAVRSDGCVPGDARRVKYSATGPTSAANSSARHVRCPIGVRSPRRQDLFIPASTLWSPAAAAAIQTHRPVPWKARADVCAAPFAVWQAKLV